MLFVIEDDWFAVPVDFCIVGVVVVAVMLDTLLTIIGFTGFVVTVADGGFSLLGTEAIFDGCFKREIFEFVDVVAIGFGSCEAVLLLLLLFFARLIFVWPDVVVTLEETVGAVILLLVSRTVEADDVV